MKEQFTPIDIVKHKVDFLWCLERELDNIVNTQKKMKRVKVCIEIEEEEEKNL